MSLFELERIEINSRAEWRRWLQQNHPQAASVWVVTRKRPSPQHVPYPDLVEEALCFGWIDSRPAKLDDERTMLLFSPRKKGSVWSKLNKERVARLDAAGLLAPAGRAKIDQAKRDGTWDILNAVGAMLIPPDLDSALRQSPSAADFFAAFPPSAKKGILQWIASAKTPATRSQRIEETVRLAAHNVRANTPQAKAYRSASTK